MKKFLKQDGTYLLSWLILFVLTFMIMVVNKGDSLTFFLQDKYAMVAVFMFVCMSLYFFFVLRNIDKKQIDLSKVFLFIAIPIGLLYCLANPLGKVPDERNHLFRAYEISQGHLISQKDENGAASREFNTTLAKITNNEHDNYSEYLKVLRQGDDYTVDTYQFSNIAVYSPLCFIPQAICLLLTRIFHCSFLVQICVARLGNMAVAIALTYLAIKKMPFKKIVCLVIAFLPITFNEMASLSPDALTNSLALFFISYILQLKYDKEKMFTKKDEIILVITTLFLSMCKIVYLPMCLLLLLIPDTKFASKKEKYSKLCGLIVIVGIINLIWLGLAFGYEVEHSNEGVNTVEQVEFVLMHPMGYCLTLIRTMNFNFRNYIFGLVGEGLGSLNVGSSALFEIPLLLLLGILFVANEDKEIKVDIASKLLILFVIVAVMVLIFTSLYVQWTSVGSWLVDGIQSRYFIPILFLLALVTQNSTFIIDKKLSYRYILLFMVFVNLHAITNIMSMYM